MIVCMAWGGVLVACVCGGGMTFGFEEESDDRPCLLAILVERHIIYLASGFGHVASW